MDWMAKQIQPMGAFEECQRPIATLAHLKKYL